MRGKLFIYCVLLSIPSAVMCQISPQEKIIIDSLKTILKTDINDTLRIKSLLTWDNIIYTNDPNLDLELNLEVEALCKRNLGKKLNKKDKLFFKRKYGTCLNNLGGSYLNQGNYGKAIEYNTHSLTVQEETGNKQGAANALNNIGIIYKDQGKFESAIDYIERSIAICEEIGDKEGAALSYGNIGVIYQMKKDYSMAFEYFRKCLEVSEALGEKLVVASTYINMGVCYREKGDIEKAVEYYNKSLLIYEETDNQEGLATVYCNLGGIFSDNGNHKKAIELNTKALVIAQEIGRLFHVMECSKSLSFSYEKTGKNKEALSMYELYLKIKDSINSEDSQKEIVRQEFKYTYEKKAMTDSIRMVQEVKIANARMDHEKTQRYILYGGLVLTLVFGFFMLSRFRAARKQKDIIQEQKQLVEEQKQLVDIKQKEVLDSIRYAMRIQQALLPSEKYFQRHIGKK